MSYPSSTQWPIVREVIVSATARHELRLIVDYLSVFGKATARSFVREFDRKVGMLREGSVEFPIARHQKLAAAGYRVALVNSYLMLYQVADDGAVRIAHVFHQSQDYAACVADVQ